MTPQPLEWQNYTHTGLSQTKLEGNLWILSWLAPLLYKSWDGD